jgi:CheY-like chemotaxis protein
MASVAQAQPAMPAKRILVVEDELMIRMLLEDMLGELGYTVTAEAGRLEEALQAAKTADLSRPADAEEAVSDGWAQANAAKRACGKELTSVSRMRCSASAHIGFKGLCKEVREAVHR